MTTEGYLKDEGGKLSKGKKYWYKVDGVSLHFFKDKGKEHQGTIDLSQASIKAVEKKKKAAVEIAIAGGKTHTLFADSPADAQAWATGLQAAQAGGAGGKKGAKMTVADFDLLNVVGKGSFGKVMQVRKKDTGAIYAMKVLSKKHIVMNNEVEHTKAERSILEKLNHPFLMNLYYSFQTDDKLYFIMEFVNGGELFHHLQREKRFEEPRVVFYAAEILSALQYLHSCGVIYRDLKPENILLRDDGHITLTDFGLCKEGLNTDTDRTDTFCVPEQHEILTDRGFLDLAAYEAALAAGADVRVAGFDRAASQVLFERPRHHVVYAHATRTLVSLAMRDNADDDVLVTRDHDLFVQRADAMQVEADADAAAFEKLPASALLEWQCGTLRQMACAPSGVQRADDELKAALEPLRRALALDSRDKELRFFELYGLWRAGSGSLESGAVRFGGAARHSSAAWLRETLHALGAAPHADGDDVLVCERAWVQTFAAAHADELCGADAHLADWLWALDAARVRCVLAGLLRARSDASDASTVRTTSVRLRDDIVRAALLAGGSAHFVADAAGAWRVALADAQSSAGRDACFPTLSHERGDVRSVAYSGRVWCFTMPSGFVWVRRAHKNKAGVVTRATRALLTGNCGTPEYLAPEVLKGEGYTKAVDWWSYGSLVFEMLTGLPPFYSQDVQEMYKNIMTQPLVFPDDVVSDAARDLLTDLLKRDLSKRLVDPNKMRDYPFFDSIDWDKLLAKEIEVPYVPPVTGKSDLGYIDPSFVEEAADLDLGDDEEDLEGEGGEGDFGGFTYEQGSKLQK